MVDYRLNETGENNCEVEWIGKKLKGKVIYTMVSGNLVFKEDI